MTGSQRWRVIIHRKAEKILKRMTGDMMNRMRNAIRGLMSNPRPDGVKKLIGYKNLYRVRVGDWRIIYAIEDDKLIILVLEISPCGSAYRDR